MDHPATSVRNDFLVTCEVAGCPDTAKTLERMYGDVYGGSEALNHPFWSVNMWSPGSELKRISFQGKSVKNLHKKTLDLVKTCGSCGSFPSTIHGFRIFNPLSPMFFEHPRCLRLRPHSSGKSCPAVFSALGAGKKFSLEMETSSSLFLGAFENRLKSNLQYHVARTMI